MLVRLVAATVLVALLGAVVRRPAVAAYVFLGTMPLLAGLSRGFGVPLLRPYEVLLVLLLAGVGTRWVVDVARDRWEPLAVTRLDVAITVLAATTSVLPLLRLYGTGQPIDTDDVLYSVLLWKYYAVFLLVRFSVRTPEQVRTCLWISMAAAVVVAVLAVMQSLRLFGVPGMLAQYYAEGEAASADNQRGLSTLASSIAVGDVMTAHVAVALALLARSRRHTLLLRALAAVFVAGALASGQFSSVIGLGVALVVLSRTGLDVRRATGSLLPVVPLAVLGTWSVLEKRLSGFSSPEGVPHSWAGRWDNLRIWFWPRLVDEGGLLLGVRPAGRLPAHENWREWIYIESGYTYLLWVGGVPCLLAFLAFCVVAARLVSPPARLRTDAVGAAATAALTSLWVVVVLMALDPHLVLRGAADSFFSLLALALVGRRAEDRPAARAAPEDRRAARAGPGRERVGADGPAGVERVPGTAR